ncbi:MAG: ATPase, T2SS/T4P/T4SS family, partial [Candidatus Brocadiia bacterium]
MTNESQEPSRVRDWLHKMLERAVQQGASDLFLKSGTRPALRVDGRVGFVKAEPVGDELMQQVASLVLGDRREHLEQAGDVDLAYQVDKVGRFRLNVYRQRVGLSAAFRHVPLRVPSFEELNLPVRQLTHLSEQSRGIVLVTGVTGSGKTTTLAAMVDYMNRHFGRHVITIEDPIEFVHEDERCLIEQREVGWDTPTFQQALKHVVRQSPDV